MTVLGTMPTSTLDLAGVFRRERRFWCSRSKIGLLEDLEVIETASITFNSIGVLEISDAE